MKHVVYIICCFLLFSFFSPVYAETIQSFTSNIDIQANGTINVEEIIIYDFEEEDRHGIFRDFPTVKTNNDGKKFRLTFTPESVTDELGTEYIWKEEKNGNNSRLKIGDPNKTIGGIKTYQIRYVVSGALTYFSDHDELYWNITGNDWEIPIQSAHVRITLPTIIDATGLGMACYTGLKGETASNCATNIQNSLGEGSTNKPLEIGEGFTVAFTFPINTVAVLEPEEIHNIFENPIVLLLMFLFASTWYVLLPLYLGYRWWRYGRDPKPRIGQASVWFDPPKTKKFRKLTPAEAGTLLDEQADLADLVATIVDLARRGFLTIVEEDKEYMLTKTQPVPNESLQSFEKILYEGLFTKGDIITLKHAELTEIVSKVKKELYEAVVQEGYFDKNPETTRTKYLLLSIVGLMTGNVQLFISCMIFGRNMPKKTLFGSDQTAIGKALKKFLSSQEKFLTFQAEQLAMFEKLLPYAVAFGVEKLWAKRFEDLDMKQPSWYVSSETSVRSVVFMNNLSHSLDSFRSAATPTSSSSGFSSGSSGGSSGGGGGGGGGGSW